MFCNKGDGIHLRILSDKAQPEQRTRGNIFDNLVNKILVQGSKGVLLSSCRNLTESFRSQQVPQ